MKIKSLFTVLTMSVLLMMSHIVYAQQMPNGGFETFESCHNGAGQQPSGGWKASSVSKTVAGIHVSEALVFDDPNGRTGHCVRIENKAVGAMGITEDAPAYISFGMPWAYISGLNTGSASGGTDGGIAFAYCPDTIEMWVKRSYSVQETAHLLVYLWSGQSIGSQYRTKNGGCGGETHFDEESDIRGTNRCTTTQTANLIGQGEWTSTQQYSSWTKVQAPITYYSNATPQKMNIIVSSADYPNGRDASKVHSGAILYADDLRFIYSSQLSEIRINNRPLSGFDKDTYTYTHVLGQGVTAVPQNITCYRNGRQIAGSELNIVYGAVGQPTTITVHAQDGSSTHTYTILFTAQQSTNSRPAAINVDGQTIQNFNGYVTNYNIQLPYGTTSCPNVTVVKAEAAQTFSVSPCNGVPGAQTVTVYAEDHNVSTTYTLNYSVATLNDNTLQGIKINGVLLDEFSPTTNSYVVNLPLGTTVAPTIEAVSAYATGEQLITIVNNGIGTTASTISVTPAGTTLTRVYRILFRVAASSNAHLSDIMLDGVSIQGFNPQTLAYTITLPQGTTTLPTVTWLTGDAAQTVTLTMGSMTTETRLVVVAQDGTTAIYRLRFDVTLSTNSKLNGIELNGEALNGFHSDTLQYHILLPIGTTQQPTVTYTKGDAAQQVRIINGGLNGTTTIRVTAEDNSTTTYQLIFSVQQSNDAKLSDLQVGGVTVDGFDPDVLHYTYILSDSVTHCPRVSATKATSGQGMQIVQPALTGTATVTVTSETGTSYNIYTIEFIYTPSSNSHLADLRVNGATVGSFDGATTNYMVTLPSKDVPHVTYVKGDSTQRVTMVAHGYSSTDVIVEAQDGTRSTYHIAYTVLPSNNALLSDIKYYKSSAEGFVSINGFAANNYDYALPLAWRTAVAPVVNPIPGDEGQTITIDYNAINDTCHIRVVAEDGLTTAHYHIAMPVAKSNIAELSNIVVGGSTLSNFDPSQLNYNILLPYGTTMMPTIGFEKALDNEGGYIYEQQVEVVNNGLGATSTITVTAEDGTTRVYSVTADVDMSDKATHNFLQNLFVDGAPIQGFSPLIARYNVTLPYGTSTAPTITFVKSYNEQSVIIERGDIHSAAKVIVKSNIIGVGDMVYHIDYTIASAATAVLSGIEIDGVALPTFNPDVHTYIYNVTSAPTSVVADAPQGVTVSDAISTLKQHTFLVESSTEQALYTIYFYYTNDVVPNTDFEDWTATTYNGGTKPTGWTAPADVVNRMSCMFSYTSGGEVNSSTTETTHGSKSCYLVSKYETQSTVWMPGLITLGQFNNSGHCLSARASSVSGGIDYRNTPDSLGLDYQLTRCNGSNNMRFVYQAWGSGSDFNSSEEAINILHTDNTVSSGTWQHFNTPLNYAEGVVPQRLNIIINSSLSENAKDSWGATGSFADDLARMYVDNLRIIFNNKLNNITINGDTLVGFNPDVFHYTVNLDVNQLALPIIECQGQVADQEHRITLSNEVNGVRTATITVKGENGDTATYVIELHRTLSTNSKLAGIYVGGVNLITDPSLTTLSYLLPLGSHRVPDLEIVKGHDYQQVNTTVNGDEITVSVSAENQNITVYTIRLVHQYSADATLNDITVVGHVLNFDAATTNYYIALTANAKNLPVVDVTKAVDGQQVTITEHGVNDTTVVKVVSEDRLNTNYYYIAFEAPASVVDTTLAYINVNDVLISGFDAAIQQYNYPTANPRHEQVTYKRTNDAADLEVTITDDKYQWLVEYSQHYQLTWQPIPSNNALLEGISVDGASVPNFDSNTFDYVVTRTTAALPTPVVDVIPGDAHQAITADWVGNVVTITVVAEDGNTQQEYIVTVNDVRTASNNALLNNIFLGGEQLPGFVATTNNYVVTLPEGTVSLPEVSVVKGDDGQNVQINMGGVNDTTRIVVTAEDGVTINEYRIVFNVALSDIATLASIDVNGVQINGFDPSVLFYNYQLPYGTTSVPMVEYTLGYPGETVSIQNNGVRGNYIITVTSESGRVTQQYIVQFSVELSHDATLRDLAVNGTTITGFDALINHYVITLPYGTTAVPTFTYQTTDSASTVVVHQPTNLSDSALFVVTAEDGLTTMTYVVKFVVSLSDNAYLSDIIINGEPLRVVAQGYKTVEDFARDNFFYTIEMPNGTTTLPTITWQTEVADYHSIALTFDSIPGVAVINVVSQDEMHVNDYSLQFSIRKSDYAYLANLMIDGVQVTGFDAETMLYELTYPVGTDSTTLPDVDNISYELGHPGQTVTVTRTERTIVVTVVAEDGVTTFSYVIEMSILLSNNALLANIFVDSVPLEGFRPEVFEYEYLLPYGASVVPTLTYQKQEESQIVDYTAGFINEASMIYVTAEDGVTEATYTVIFRVSEDNPGDTPTADDVSFNYLGDGVWRASTTRNNVFIRVFTVSGQILMNAEVPVADPNEDIHQPDCTGVTFRADKSGTVYVYSFIYEKQRLKSDKFVY